MKELLPRKNTDLVEVKEPTEASKWFVDSAEESEKTDETREFETGLMLGTDLWRAKLFVQHHRGELRYLNNQNRWMMWNGCCWCSANPGDLLRLAAQTGVKMGQIVKMKKNRKLMGMVRAAQSIGGITAMLSLAKGFSELSAAASAFDRSTSALNLHNGTFDLLSGKFSPHNPADMLSKMAAVSYDPEAIAPNWASFIDKIFDGDADLIRYVKKIIGYSLTGETKEQCLFILFGEGSNGKSTFLRIIKWILGEYAQTLPIETIIARNKPGASNGIARLQGIRLVVANELNHGAKLDEALVKQLTGDEEITARFLFKEYVEFQPQAKIFLATNRLPEIQGNDVGIWRRFRIVPFNHIFRETEQDKNLFITLMQEVAGILNWCLEGYKMYRAEGLELPEAVKQATEGFREQAIGDKSAIERFLHECCELDPHAKVGMKALHFAFSAWCDDHAEVCVSIKQLGKALVEEHKLAKNRSMADGSTALCGIRLRSHNSQNASSDEQQQKGTLTLVPKTKVA